MTVNRTTAHPWMANSVPALKRAMLAEIGAESIEQLFEQIPADHRLKRPLALPPALRSESELKRHLVDLVSRNQTCEQNLSFLGAGVWQHHVPAVCDEIVGRTEFLTNVWGSAQSDHGRNQAWFEYASMLGALLELDVVGLPVYSWGCAIGHAVRMAARITGRTKVLVPSIMDPERLAVLRTYCEPDGMHGHLDVVSVANEPETGLMDLLSLGAALGPDVAAVYVETPSYVGIVEARAEEIAAMAHGAGALVVAGCDPISLGVLRPPGDWSADIATGPTQPLGVHMNCGGGTGGYVASRDGEAFVREYNGFLIGMSQTVRPGRYGFSLVNGHQTSYGLREHGKDWTGNSVYLWAIANAVYMALLGPEGFREVGELIVSRAHYAARQLAEIPGVRLVHPRGFFKEFLVDVNGTGMTVAQINRGLRRSRIFGGKDVSSEFPDRGQVGLWCVTEVHTQDDIDRLAAAFREVVVQGG
ncbi:MAG: aminomethyl-transferring glycine dehydrogenase subunit GcvPA [Alsobacter sp.]